MNVFFSLSLFASTLAAQTTGALEQKIAPDLAQMLTTQTTVAPPVASPVEDSPAPSAPESPGRRRDRSGPAGKFDPDWLVKVARADDFRETGAREAQTLPYIAAGDTAAPQAHAAHAIQPSGPLSGKIVFVMAGHGWTYDPEKQTWFTQRGLNLGIVEDFGNQDQMSIFAHYAWRAGATVVPLRPIDHQMQERVLDNTSPQTKLYGPWMVSTSSIYHGSPIDDEPYLYTTATLTESAVARYQPWISEAGDYPVYAWVRDGQDRVHQCYRIVHAGGVTDVRVDHRRVGKGWVWLGTHYFETGDSGYVEISNAVCDPYEADGRNVVIADGIRFGNGYGDVRRPAGVSGFPREDEGDIYWIQRSLGHTADPRIYGSTPDASGTVNTPPKTAAYMNRESDGRYYDRLLLSFHSNALAGKSRGAVGLYNQSTSQRMPYQEKLADMLGRELNNQMLKGSSLAEAKWAPRARVTYNGINFGELRKDYVRNEMAASIIETAFHDNVEDAKFLLDPASRMDMARACVRAISQWFNSVSQGSQIIPMMPTQPRNLMARCNGTTVTLTWIAGPVGRYAGDPAADFTVYLSRDGRSFDAGHNSQGASVMELRLTSGTLAAPDEDPVSTETLWRADTVTSRPWFARVCAVNPGGESWPSQTLGFLPLPDSTTSKVLVISASAQLDASTNMLQQKGLGLQYPIQPVGTVQRVRPNISSVAYDMIAAADVLTTMATPFDSCSETILSTEKLNPADYSAILWLNGEWGSAADLASTTVQTLVKDFTSSGGKFLLVGPVGEVLSQLSAGWLRELFGVIFTQRLAETSRLVDIGSGRELLSRGKNNSEDAIDMYRGVKRSGARQWVKAFPHDLLVGTVRWVGNGGMVGILGTALNTFDPEVQQDLLEEFLVKLQP